MVKPKNTALIPEPVLELQRHLEQFRSAQPPRTKLPATVWDRAVELARQYGVYAVAHPLRLDYIALRTRVGGAGLPQRGVGEHARPSTPASFVELISPAAQECVIEFESVRGGKMRIQWKASAPPDWASLLRAGREAER
jgi:hypothetical protein